jgi:16S rRNA G1207 methylase RsmC
VVANAFIRYERAMHDLYSQVEILAENRRYHVLQATEGKMRGRAGESDRP